MQFWTLEPDVICRLVFVKDVQYDDSGGGGSGAAAGSSTAAGSSRGGAAASCSAAAGSGSGSGGGTALQLSVPGQTELPTCPVCLERLDAHISGIVTTVCFPRHFAVCSASLGVLLGQCQRHHGAFERAAQKGMRVIVA